MKINLGPVFDALINKLHIAIGTVYAVGLVVMKWKTGHDIGPNLATASLGFYAFLLGHAYTYQRLPDQPNQLDSTSTNLQQ
jgi:hypothetical protein